MGDEGSKIFMKVVAQCLEAKGCAALAIRAKKSKISQPLQL